jgi:hypothetical protein
LLKANKDAEAERRYSIAIEKGLSKGRTENALYL